MHIHTQKHTFRPGKWAYPPAAVAERLLSDQWNGVLLSSDWALFSGLSPTETEPRPPQTPHRSSSSRVSKSSWLSSLCRNFWGLSKLFCNGFYCNVVLIVFTPACFCCALILYPCGHLHQYTHCKLMCLSLLKSFLSPYFVFFNISR